ncbi:MAG: hypothetical protein WCI87_09090 [Euryarchaeota archaeon]
MDRAPVSLPVIKKDFLTEAEEGAEIVRVVEVLVGVAVTVVLGVCASTQGATQQNSKTLTINVTKKIIKSGFSARMNLSTI